MDVILNISIDEIMIADFQSKNTQEDLETLVKHFDEYPRDYQMYAQAGFLVWKLVALVYYSGIKLEDYSFVRLDKISKGPSETLQESNSPTNSSDEDGGESRRIRWQKH